MRPFLKVALIDTALTGKHFLTFGSSGNSEIQWRRKRKIEGIGGGGEEERGRGEREEVGIVLNSAEKILTQESNNAKIVHLHFFKFFTRH